MFTQFFIKFTVYILLYIVILYLLVFGLCFKFDAETVPNDIPDFLCVNDVIGLYALDALTLEY